PGDPIPLARHRARIGAAGSARHRDLRRRRDHGGPASGAPRNRRPVPPRVGPDRTWLPDDRAVPRRAGAAGGDAAGGRGRRTRALGDRLSAIDRRARPPGSTEGSRSPVVSPPYHLTPRDASRVGGVTADALH